jgi:type II secretory pathway component GspD/PulD (secretin)
MTPTRTEYETTPTRTESETTPTRTEYETIPTRTESETIPTLRTYEKTPEIVETETVYEQIPTGYQGEYYRPRGGKPFVSGSFDSVRGGTLSFSLLNDMVDIELALSILQQQVEAKLLANPRVLVLDNQTANFEIIRQVPYRELLQVAREDPITYTEFKDVGVSLNVTPHIARDGMIRLHIMPEFGVLVSQNAVSVLTTKDDFGRDVHQNVLGAPTVDTRRADTTALIRDGQTIVIGGLRKRQTSKNISKVPVLGDMPVIGGLFKSETESVQINELVIFITTRIVTEPVLSGIERKQFEATEFASPGMTKMRLERNNQLKPTVDKFKVEELTELIDQLLRK